MSNSLRGKRISDTYHSLVQIIDGEFYDGAGNPIAISGGGGSGATGEGFQGPQGFRGLQGFAGGTGPQGYQGWQGLTGPQGYGPQGWQGNGVQGARGYQGVPGPAGGGTGSGDARVWPRNNFTTGGTQSWDPAYKLLVIDPTTTITNLNLILPDTSTFTGGELYYLSFGGQMTSGIVVNNFTVSPNSLSESVLATTIQGTCYPGDGLVFCWDLASSAWRLF